MVCRQARGRSVRAPRVIRGSPPFRLHAVRASDHTGRSKRQGAFHQPFGNGCARQRHDQRSPPSEGWARMSTPFSRAPIGSVDPVTGVYHGACLRGLRGHQGDRQDRQDGRCRDHDPGNRGRSPISPVTITISIGASLTFSAIGGTPSPVYFQPSLTNGSVRRGNQCPQRASTPPAPRRTPPTSSSFDRRGFDPGHSHSQRGSLYHR